MDLSHLNIPAPFDGRVALKNVQGKWIVRQLRFYPKTGSLCETGGMDYKERFPKRNDAKSWAESNGLIVVR